MHFHVRFSNRPFRVKRFQTIHDFTYSQVPVAKLAHLVVRLRHVRKVEGLTSFRQRGPRIPQPGIMVALFGIVCFLRQRCTSGGRLPCGLALGSHLALPFRLRHPHKTNIAITSKCASWSPLSFPDAARNWLGVLTITAFVIHWWMLHIFQRSIENFRNRLVWLYTTYFSEEERAGLDLRLEPRSYWSQL